MQIEIDDDVVEQVRGLTTLKLVDRDFYYFSDWLLRVGLATVRTTLEKNPQLTVGDLAMMQYRFNHQ